MAEADERELTRIIKSREAAGAYYIYGSDFFSVGRYKRALVSSVVDKDNETLNLHEYEGKDIDIEGISAACEGLPMFAEKLCVTVRDLDLDRERLDADRMKLLTETVKNLPETTVLIFYEPNTTIPMKNNFRENKMTVSADTKNKKLTDLIAKHGTLCYLPKKDRIQTAKQLCAMVAKKGGNLEMSAAELLYDRCGGDMLAITGELGKLTAYANGAPITRETVELITPVTLDMKAFDLADAITAGDARGAMKIYNELLDMHTEPIYLLTVIAGSMNDLYRARLALDCNKSVDDAAQDFGYKPNVKFRLKRAFSAVNRVGIDYLRQCSEIMAQADMAFKTGSGIPRIIIETAIIKMLSLPRR